MIPVSAELADAIEAPERHPLVRLSVDWDDDGHDGDGSLDDLSPLVESLTIERALAGDLPDEVSLVEGAAAAALTVTLGAGDPWEGIPASRYFNRLNVDGPLAGKELLSAPVTVDIGMRTGATPDAQFVRRFTGRTRSFKAAAGDRSARMTALDLREMLSWAADLPLVGRAGYGLNASWALSSILRRVAFLSGFRVSPEPEGWGTGLFVPMHGSLYLPDGPTGEYTARVIRSMGYPTTTTGTSWSDVPTTPTFIAGPYLAGSNVGVAGVDRLRRNVTRGEIVYDKGISADDYQVGRVEFWTKRRGAALGEGTSAWRVAAVYTNSLGTAGIMAGVNGNNQLVVAKHAGNPNSPTVLATGPTIPNDGAWHYVGIEWNGRAGGGAATITFRLDAVTSTPATAAFPSADPFSVNVVRVYWRQPLSELFYQAEPDFNNPEWCIDLVHTVNAKLDFSTLELDAIPETGRRPAWDWLRRIAQAEQAVVYVDESGVLRYRLASRQSDADAQDAVKEVTATGSLVDLDLDDALDGVRNQVTATVHPITIADTVAPIYTSADVWSVAPHTSGHLLITLNTPALDIDLTVTLNRPADAAPSTATTFVCVSFKPDGTSTGDAITETQYAALTTSLSDLGGLTYDLSIRNDTDRTLYIATSKANTPVVSLAGKAFSIGTQEIGSFLGHPTGMHPSVRRHGPQVLKLPDNPWMQSVTAAQGLVQRVLYDLFQPAPVVRELEIVADPRLQLGDRIRITDAAGLALDADYWISAIRETYGDAGYRMRITGRPASTTLRWGTGKWGINSWGVQ